MNGKKVFFEKVKTVILVVLFFMTILLLYFLWYGMPSAKFAFSKQEEPTKAIEMESVVIPENILISKGGEDFVNDHTGRGMLWNAYILPEIRRMCSASPMVTEEISKEQYKKIENSNAVIAQFAYLMDFTDFCKSFDIKEFQGIDKIESFSELSFSTASTESIFVSDPQREKYYRLIGNFKTDIMDKIMELANDGDFQTYYRLGTLTGNDSKYDVFVPIDEPKAIPDFELGRTLSEISEKEHDKIAEAYFGNSFDFVRKVKENDGTVAYMYGYGKITLTIDLKHGAVEYKNDSDKAGSQTALQALNTALAFAGQKRCFETVAGDVSQVVLKKISAISDESSNQNKKTGYKFEFGILADGYEIFSNNKSAIVIDVVNGEVTYFYKNFFTRFMQAPGRMKATLQPIDIIVENHEALLAKTDEKEKAAKLQFNDVIQEIRSMKYGYLKQKNMLVPAWEIRLGANTAAYFDPSTGKEIE